MMAHEVTRRHLSYLLDSTASLLYPPFRPFMKKK
jgi:hypothetical protein